MLPQKVYKLRCRRSLSPGMIIHHIAASVQKKQLRCIFSILLTYAAHPSHFVLHYPSAIAASVEWNRFLCRFRQFQPFSCWWRRRLHLHLRRWWWWRRRHWRHKHIAYGGAYEFRRRCQHKLSRVLWPRHRWWRMRRCASNSDSITRWCARDVDDSCDTDLLRSARVSRGIVRYDLQVRNIIMLITSGENFMIELYLMYANWTDH